MCLLLCNSVQIVLQPHTIQHMVLSCFDHLSAIFSLFSVSLTRKFSPQGYHMWPCRLCTAHFGVLYTLTTLLWATLQLCGTGPASLLSLPSCTVQTHLSNSSALPSKSNPNSLSSIKPSPHSQTSIQNKDLLLV